jgi:hypothetical protein
LDKFQPFITSSKQQTFDSALKLLEQTKLLKEKIIQSIKGGTETIVPVEVQTNSVVNPNNVDG